MLMSAFVERWSVKILCDAHDCKSGIYQTVLPKSPGKIFASSHGWISGLDTVIRTCSLPPDGLVSCADLVLGRPLPSGGLRQHHLLFVLCPVERASLSHNSSRFDSDSLSLRHVCLPEPISIVKEMMVPAWCGQSWSRVGSVPRDPLIYDWGELLPQEWQKEWGQISNGQNRCLLKEVTQLFLSSRLTPVIICLKWEYS